MSIFPRATASVVAGAPLSSFSNIEWFLFMISVSIGVSLFVLLDIKRELKAERACVVMKLQQEPNPWNPAVPRNYTDAAEKACFKGLE